MSGKSDDWNNRILLVDDDERMHGLFRRILKMPSFRAPLQGGLRIEESLPFQLDSAFQGTEALEMIQLANAAGTPFALVFMDMEMPPGWDGIETIEQIKRTASDVEIAVCSGHWNESREERLRAIEGTAEIPTVAKPFHNGEIHQLACRLVMRWNQAHAVCSAGDTVKLVV